MDLKEIIINKIEKCKTRLVKLKKEEDGLHPQFDCHLTHDAGEKVAFCKGKIAAYEDILKTFQVEE